uniref:hypothetical protein n=1 Tax=Streptomyces calvus TaxID=67282 RepID=UPI00351555A3
MRLVVQAWLTSRTLVAKTVSVLQFGFGDGFGLGFGFGFSAVLLGCGAGAGGAGAAATGFGGSAFFGFSLLGDELGFSAT